MSTKGRLIRLVDGYGHKLTALAALEQAAEMAIAIALETAQAMLLILPDGRCLWTERRPSGVWTLAGE